MATGNPRSGPSDRLIAMFRACSRDPTEAIEARLRHMLYEFLQHLKDNAGNETAMGLATKCCREAGIWYYRILEIHAGQDESRPGISGVSVIFENEPLQRCLVACCLEVTISSRRLPCEFPQLLQIFKLAPYHFYRVIELVVRADAGLPHAAVNHLAQVEDKVLESLAWTSDSPLWKEIGANEGHLPTCQQVMPPTWLEDPKRTESQPDGNQSGAGTDQQRSPSAVNWPRRSDSLHRFARKVYSLMGRRLRELCATLDVCDELRLKIWTCFEHSLVNCTDLMIDRHLDQLLMCAMYIMDKITKGEIPFKHIMKCYKSQPLACTSVCRNVLISRRDTLKSHAENNNNGDHSGSVLTPNTPSMHYPGPCQEERGNLIDFYNNVYRITMQDFAMQFAPNPGGDTPPLSPYPRQWKASPRRHRLSSNHSIFISPYNAETPRPPTPGLCYFFNSSPSECLREINNMIKTGRSPNRRSHAGPLDGEEDEDDEDGPPAKRLRLDGQSAWQRRLRNVVNDREARRDRDQPSPVTKANLH